MRQVPFVYSDTYDASEWTMAKGPAGSHREIPTSVLGSFVRAPKPGCLIFEYVVKAEDDEAKVVGFLSSMTEVVDGVAVLAFFLQGSPNLLTRTVESPLSPGRLHSAAMMPAFLRPNWCTLLVECSASAQVSVERKLSFDLMLDRWDPS